jgi:putative ABC transport system permease protein
MKITVRNLFRFKTFSIINILGLSIGLAACLFIFFYVLDELCYDSFFPEADRIFRVEVLCKNQDGEQLWDRAPGPLTYALEKDFPQIEHAVHCTGNGDLVVRIADDKYLEKGTHVNVSDNFFSVFSFDFFVGDPTTALIQPNSVVLSREMALKYFGSTEVIGKELNFDDTTWRVTGVFNDLAQHTHLRNFKILTSFSSVRSEWYYKWDGVLVPTYIKFRENIDVDDFKNRIQNIADRYYPEILKAHNETHIYQLLPLTDVHLKSGAESAQRRDQIFLFSAIAFFILCLSCLNFINLSTARSMNRAKEVCVRKVVGSDRRQLIGQFIAESFIICLIALSIALILFEWLLPFFNSLTGKDIAFLHYAPWKVGMMLLALMIVTGFLAGIYPAFFLSAFKPVYILKGMREKGIGNYKLRSSLMVFQFVIATVLIIATLVIYKQIHYMKSHDLGFDADHMLVIPTQNAKMADILMKDYNVVKNEFSKHPSIQAITAHLRAPGRVEHESDFTMEGRGDKNFHMITLFVDHDFISTYRIGLVAGRKFDNGIPSDKGSAFMINEAATRSLGFTTPAEALGKKMSYWGGSGEIIGVTRDFNFSSLHHLIEPLVMQYPARFVPEAMTMKLHSSNLQETISFLKQTWEKIYPDNPFDYYFLDDDFNSLYKDDERFGTIVFIFSCLALSIACMGLLGLTVFTAQQQIKEIGIRKVLGATHLDIMNLLGKEFGKVILIATLIAWPIAWYFSKTWLQNYAYRIEINLWIFTCATFLVIWIALITVSIQAMKATLANPVESLRYE